MKKLVGTVLAGMAVLLVLAAPASAQRDPFDPVIDTTVDNTTGGTATDGTADPNGTGDPTSPSNPDARADVFPNTGADTTGWLAIAYVLLASGAALVVFSKTMKQTPQPRPSPKH